MLILGIETSCDESAVAVYDTTNNRIVDKIFSQIDIHREYGGVVPEIASRNHLIKITSLLNDALQEAKLSLQDVDYIAYTQGPGLVGSLLTGAAFANALAFALNIKTIPIHHMEGHLLAPFIKQKLTFPFLALLVSGGHTELLLAKSLGDYEVLGSTVDDAVGEAFDKVAKLMGLPYPGGPQIEALAMQSTNKERFYFTRPMINRPGLDFSFSGLKTAVLTAYNKADKQDINLKADLAFAFEDAITDTIYRKCLRALKSTKAPVLVVAGGVSANKTLRNKLLQLKEASNTEILFPEQKLCTDNAAMIAFAASLYTSKATADYNCNVFSRMSLDTFNVVR